jgi:hypothetical protein
MRGLITIVAGVLCSGLWLGLLVATDFNPVTVSAGLLGMIYVTGSPANLFRHHKKGLLSPAAVARQHPAPSPRKDTP